MQHRVRILYINLPACLVVFVCVWQPCLTLTRNSIYNCPPAHLCMSFTFQMALPAVLGVLAKQITFNFR